MKKRLKTILSEILPSSESDSIYNSYDVVGDIAIIRLTREAKFAKDIAQAVMSTHKNVRTVLAQTNAVSGEFRLRRLEHVAGERKTHTIHREFGCAFSVDVQECYFSPRLLHERMRIARLVEEGETVVNMFAGVGCFSILIARHSKAGRVYSIDANPAAVHCMKENIRINRAYGKVLPLLGDAGEIIQERLCNTADRVLMPLPEKALEYLPFALMALKERGGWIHYYGFEYARGYENPVEKVSLKVEEKLRNAGAVFKVASGRVVRTTGPHWYQVVLDIQARSSGDSPSSKWA